MLFALFLNYFKEFIYEKFQGIDILPRKIDSAFKRMKMVFMFILSFLLYSKMSE